jgi:hypothetical protein
MQSGDRARAAVAKLENSPHYYLFRHDAGIAWVFAQNRTDALAYAGGSAPKWFPQYDNAGIALRVALHHSAHWNTPVLNLQAFEAAAAKDPEPEETARHHRPVAKGGK